MSASYLVGYDYGMGGLWAVVRARSEREIRDVYPELIVVEEQSGWMSDDFFDRLGSDPIDVAEDPRGILAIIISDRGKRGFGQ